MEKNRELTKIMGIARRQKWWFILPFLFVFYAVTAVAFLLPDIFLSYATILIQNSQIPSNLVPSTVTSYADQRIQAITQEVTSRTKVLSLVEKYNLLADKRDRYTSEQLVEKVTERIKVEPIDAEIKKETENKPVLLTIAFKLSYEDENAKTAQMVANEISSYYLEKNLQERTKHARSTAQFLEAQLNQVRGRVDELEAKLATYREAHLEELPEFTNLNMQKLEKLNGEISNLNMQIRSLEEQRAAIKNRLTIVDPHTRGDRVLSVEERVQQAQMERAALVSRYSEKHPAVIAKNQEVALLESKSLDSRRLTELRDQITQVEQQIADLRSRYTAKHPAVRSKQQELVRVREELRILQEKAGQQTDSASAEYATNPAYVALKADLDKLGVSIAAASAEKARLEEQMSAVYAKLHAMPQVSKEYNELTTDYQNAKVQYNDLQQKLMAAQVSQGMEEEQLGETFQVVEPAVFPEEPAKPKRLLIILIGAMLGLGISVGLGCLRELFDNSVRDVEKLEAVSGFPVLSVIPRIVTERDRIRARRKKVAGFSAACVCIVAVVVVFHLFVMDVHVFYAKLEHFIYRKIPI